MRVTAAGVISISISAAILTLGGCCHSESFKATDKGFLPTARTQAPPVFLDRLPPIPYRRVGMIDVARSNSTPLNEFIDAALARATTVGCDVVIDTFALGGTSTYCKATPACGGSDCCTRRFVCGAYIANDEAQRKRRPSLSGAAAGQP